MGMATLREIIDAILGRKLFVPNGDDFTNLTKLREALKNEGMKSSNLIIGIDFSNCNQNIVKHSVHGHGTHAMNPNPYEHAIKIVGKALAGFDEDNKIPCFGFGDVTTRDQKVFKFFKDGAPCYGFEEVLKRYRTLLPRINFSEPSSFAPIIHAAIDVVKSNENRYHILVIIANGQVSDTNRTTRAIVYASSFPLSIIVVGVGEGPWDSMKQFDDALPKRKFDNFQFVNYTEIVKQNKSQQDIELACTLATLMELPQQFKAIKNFPHKCKGREKNAIIISPP